MAGCGRCLLNHHMHIIPAWCGRTVHHACSPAALPLQFVAFMRNSTSEPDDPLYNWPRVCAIQNELSSAGWTPESCAASRGLQPAFMPPAQPLQPADIFEALRNHYQGTPQDAYELRDPKDKWRPVAVLRTAMAHGALG